MHLWRPHKIIKFQPPMSEFVGGKVHPFLGTFKPWLVDEPFWTITAILTGCMGVYRHIFYPLLDVVWLEHPAFQEELVKSPTFHNFADPILHNIVIKDIFAWVHLVSTEQITNREIIGATTVRNWIEIYIPAIVCSKLKQAMGRRKRNRKRFFVEGGNPNSSPLWDTLRDDEPPALLSLACMLREALKTNEKESYTTQTIEISDVGIPDTLPPPPYIKKS